MNGGSITDNIGDANTTSAVCILDHSEFTMNGGSVSNNSAFHTGGVVALTYSAFTMNGGTIANNTSQGDGGGVRTQTNSTFIMNGGTISGNTTEISWGGGVYIGGHDYPNTFTMNGGSITGNTTLLGGGGGVFINNGTFTMNGGTIAENTASTYGGGVYAAGYGGGELEAGENVGFIMKGGTIAGNIASLGGGVAIITGGTFRKEPLAQGGASGIIYGSNGGDNRNRATAAESLLQNDRGQAVYFGSDVPGGLKHRELTAGPGDHLDGSISGEAGGWIE
jgi:hypothetical protein